MNFFKTHDIDTYGGPLVMLPKSDANIWQGCVDLKPEEHYPLRQSPLSDSPSRYSYRTIRSCRPYRSSHAGCQCDRSGSSSLPDSFRLRHWCGCAPARAVHSCRDRGRYRYTCRLGFPAGDGCRHIVLKFLLRKQR